MVSVAGTVPDFVLLGPEGDEYASLFNTFRVSENHWLQWGLSGRDLA
jgi:hypothetical protein